LAEITKNHQKSPKSPKQHENPQTLCQKISRKITKKARSFSTQNNQHIFFHSSLLSTETKLAELQSDNKKNDELIILHNFFLQN